MASSLPPVPKPWLSSDLPLALGVAVLTVLGSAVAVKDDIWAQAPDVAGPLVPSPTELFLLLAGSLPLALRRVAPVTVFAVCAAAFLGLQGLGRPAPLPLGVLVALYTVATRCRPFATGVAAAVYVAALLAGTVSGAAALSDDMFFDYLVVVAGSAMLGYGVALSRAQAGLAEQRATELTREQEGRTRAAVKEEQARIAREVHDIVAHDVSVIVAQAAAARRVLTSQPDAATRALSSIEAVGRDALDGLRRLLDLLRTEPSEPGWSPQPSLDHLPWLLAQVRQAGLTVDLTVRGQARELPATVELNAYRIIQESLTNSLKHAGPTRTAVVLDYRSDSLDIEVSDHGPSGPAPAARDAGACSGYGLIGMQQRVALLGGELTAGSEDQHGFRVAAHLPMAGVVP
jgi:signal transduction histidine kinase